MKAIPVSIINFYRDERGISSVEYVLISALLAGGIVLAANVLAGAVAERLADTGSCLEEQQQAANGGNGAGIGFGGSSGGSGGLGLQNGQGFAGC